MSVNDDVYGSRVKNTSIVVDDVAKESPAFRAGIVQGSTILKVVSGGVVAPLTTATSLIAFIAAHQNTPFTITYVAPDGVQKSTTMQLYMESFRRGKLLVSHSIKLVP